MSAAPELMIYADGLCEPNPGGWACWGWVAYDGTGERIGEACGCLEHTAATTNNQAVS